MLSVLFKAGLQTFGFVTSREVARIEGTSDERKRQQGSNKFALF
jgi:hypothetical protein